VAHDLFDDGGLALATVTATFGDQTRRDIYLFVRQNPTCSVNDIASACKVHPNVARYHIGILKDAGHVVETTGRRTGKGRPPRGYEVTDKVPDLTPPARGESLMVALLERALEKLGPEQAEQVALEVGRSFGRDIAERDGIVPDSSMASETLSRLASALTRYGFNARADGDEVIAAACPFGTAPGDHPVLCAIDRGFMSGMLSSWGEGAQPVRLATRARTGGECRTSIS